MICAALLFPSVLHSYARWTLARGDRHGNIKERLSYRTVYPSRPPSALDISTAVVGLLTTVSVPKRSALNTSRRELSEDVSFGIGTTGTWHLVVEQSSLEKPPQGEGG